MDELLKVFSIIVILDLILDILVVAYQKQYNLIFEILRRNLFKIAAYFISIAIVVQLDIFLGNSDLFKDSLITFTIANEILLMLDNLKALGVPFPRVIREMLENIKNNKNENTKG